MAEWLTSPSAWFSFAVVSAFVFGLGYETRRIIERRREK